MASPKVFLCHASEDKARFVEPFAKALMAKGVDAFYDGWEIGPGDSLWEKIARGIDESNAFILIASHASLGKPWVKLEIGGGLAAKLEKGNRFIILALDGCAAELPSLLKAFRYLSVDDTNNFEEVVQQLVESLHGFTRKPQLGAEPAFVSAPDPPAGLECTKADWLVLTLLAATTRHGIDGVVGDTECLSVRTQSGLADESFTDSLEALEGLGYLQLSKGMGRKGLGRGIQHIRVTIDGFEAYLQASEPTYGEIKQRALAAIVNRESCGGTELCADAGCTHRVGRHIAEWVQQNGLAKASFPLGPEGRFSIYAPSVKLRRLVEG